MNLVSLFEILFYSIVLVMSSVVYFDPIAHDFFYFQRYRQFFRINSLVKANKADIRYENEYIIRKWLVLKFHGSGHLPNHTTSN
jgi:hypothetical protein